MKLNPAEDSEYLYCRLQSEDGKIEMGVYPVMFGYRVRAGYVDSGYYNLDWCCGANQGLVEWVYAALKTILENRDTSNPFEGLLIASNIKPLYLDIEFMKWLVKTVGIDVDPISLPPVEELKLKMLKTVGWA